MPLSEQVRVISDEEVILKELIIEGILSIQMGEHPNNINRKLLNFMAPKFRLNSEGEAA